jgi:RNA 2',3'-cyclic 3'-phosphodiesterase
MRLFVAAAVPGELKARLAAEQVRVLACGGLRPVEEGNLHVTLKFLGEVAQERLPAVQEALAGVRHPPFQATVRGLGAFPGPGRPRVVWAGFSEGAGDIESLHSRVDAALLPLGFPADERFHPHVTLARTRGVPDAGALGRLIEASGAEAYGTYAIGSFELMESASSPKGPTYKEHSSFHLG